MKTAVGVLLVIHGLITMALSAGSFDTASAGVSNPAWLKWWPTPMVKSWLFSLMGQSRSGSIEPLVGVLWLLAGAAIVAAGLGVLGFLVPAAYWRLLAGVGAALSLVVIVIYAHPFYVVGTAANVAILVVLSQVLPQRTNRWANMIVGVVTIAYIWGGGLLSAPHYIFMAGMETLGLVYIVWFAWKWREEDERVPARNLAAE